MNIHAFIDNTVASSFYLVYIAWFFVKLFLYVIPLANIMLLSSENKRSNLFVLALYMVPVVEIVAYFYIITISLPRIFANYENKHLSNRCLEYGLAAGIVNIVILTRLTDSFESYLTFYNYRDGLVTSIMNASLLSVWLVLAISHLKLLHDVKITYIRARISE